MAPATPAKDKDRRAQTVADRRRVTSNSTVQLGDPEQAGSEGPEDGFLPTNVALPQDGSQEQLEEYGYLGHAVHIVLGIEDVQRLLEVVSEEIIQRGELLSCWLWKPLLTVPDNLMTCRLDDAILTVEYSARPFVNSHTQADRRFFARTRLFGGGPVCHPAYASGRLTLGPRAACPHRFGRRTAWNHCMGTVSAMATPRAREQFFQDRVHFVHRPARATHAQLNTDAVLPPRPPARQLDFVRPIATQTGLALRSPAFRHPNDFLPFKLRSLPAIIACARAPSPLLRASPNRPNPIKRTATASAAELGPRLPGHARTHRLLRASAPRCQDSPRRQLAAQRTNVLARSHAHLWELVPRTRWDRCARI